MKRKFPFEGTDQEQPYKGDTRDPHERLVDLAEEDRRGEQTDEVEGGRELARHRPTPSGPQPTTIGRNRS